MNVLYKAILIATFLILRISAFSQAPPLQWQKNFGGNLSDSLLVTAQNNQGDIYIAGFGYSTTGDLSGNAGSADIWLAKLDPLGNKIWDRTYGGSLRDRVVDIATTSDGSALLLCYSESTNGTFASVGNVKGVWVMKISPSGTLSTLTSFGGNPQTSGAIISTSDGGYLFASNVQGTNGVVTSAGLNDIWLVKANSVGAISWQKSLGGTLQEYPAGLLEKNSNYYILGSSNSPTVNTKANHGDYDLLVAQYSFSGTRNWTQLFGGMQEDRGVAITDAGTDIMYVGNVKSNNGDLYIKVSNDVDAWVIKTDETGLLGLDGLIIGSSADDFAAGLVFEPFFGVPIISGTIYGTFGSGNPTVPNIFVASAEALGGIDWIEIFGGSGLDIANDLLIMADGGLLVTGHSTSSNGNLTANYGASDFWALKLHDPCPDTYTDFTSITIDENFNRTSRFSITGKVKITGANTRAFFDSPAITLEPGFQVDSGTVFYAIPAGCN
ncbi:hypothetical protein SAMN06298216_2738 [Spirosomataceae bacterium TFI 002]|nr:hypothetical protein SAMN06298216_2738 [Spirosomataceae bacterium TFI 002]